MYVYQSTNKLLKVEIAAGVARIYLERAHVQLAEAKNAMLVAVIAKKDLWLPDVNVYEANNLILRCTDTLTRANRRVTKANNTLTQAINGNSNSLGVDGYTAYTQLVLNQYLSKAKIDVDASKAKLIIFKDIGRTLDNRDYLEDYSEYPEAELLLAEIHIEVLTAMILTGPNPTIISTLAARV